MLKTHLKMIKADGWFILDIQVNSSLLRESMRLLDFRLQIIFGAVLNYWEPRLPKEPCVGLKWYFSRFDEYLCEPKPIASFKE